MVLQRTYDINPDLGFPGALARPSEPHSLESGILHVPSAGRAPRPGDALYYDEGEGAFALPTDAAQDAAVCAILSYRADQVASADSIVRFADGDEIQFGRLGTFWVVAGSAMQYGQQIRMARDDYQWDPKAAHAPAAAGNSQANINAAIAAALQSLGRYPIVCVSRDPVSAGGMAQAQIGFGRIL